MTTTTPTDSSIDWQNLGFDYVRTDWRYRAHWKGGAWEAGALTEDNQLHLSEGSTSLHYGQQCFEGLKAYRCQDGSINLFRPDQNAARMQRSCARVLMPAPSSEMFVEACKQVVLANERFLPPFDPAARCTSALLSSGWETTLAFAARRSSSFRCSVFRWVPTSKAA